jgi:hypothetical protein
MRPCIGFVRGKGTALVLSASRNVSTVLKLLVETRFGSRATR